MVACDLRRQISYPRAVDGAFGPGLIVREADPGTPQPPKLLDRVRHAVRTRHYSRRTERTYVDWIRRFIVFHGKRHPLEMGADEVTAYLSWLAVQGKVTPSTQNPDLPGMTPPSRAATGSQP